MQCIYALTFYLSFEAFSKGLKHLLKYCSFANLAEVFSDFSLKKKRKHYKFGVGITARVKMCTQGIFFSSRGLSSVVRVWCVSLIIFHQFALYSIHCSCST